MSNSQSGAVLPISLIMVLLLTMIGVTGMQTTSLEEKMAGNSRDRNLAFQAAESALREGENFLTAASLPTFTTGGTNGLYAISSTVISENTLKTSDTFWSNNDKTVKLNNEDVEKHVVSAPRYVIQQLAFSEGGGQSLDAGIHQENEMYQVTARGVGGNATTVVIVQSTYKR
ncbi:MAG: pilus assembly protein PilX [Methylomicrobium sp.]|nr:pilus assembly protein PilX [Methylomicrobium sp.]